MDEWLDLKANLTKAIEESPDLEAIEAIRISALGKKGSITGLMKGLGALDAEQRREAGQLLNKIKTPPNLNSSFLRLSLFSRSY